MSQYVKLVVLLSEILLVYRREVNILWVTFLIFRRRRRRLLMCVAGVPVPFGHVIVRQVGRAVKQDVIDF